MLDQPVFILLILGVVCFAGLCYRFIVAAQFHKEDGVESILETRKAFLAAATLIGLGALYLAGMIFYYYAPAEKQNIGRELHEGVKTVVPPFMALIMGYFFGKSSNLAVRNDKEKRKAKESEESN